MADINKLKDKIKSTIYPNGKGAINASDHQAMLLDMADGMAETDTKLAELSEEVSEISDVIVGGETKYTEQVSAGTRMTKYIQASGKVAIKVELTEGTTDTLWNLYFAATSSSLGQVVKTNNALGEVIVCDIPKDNYGLFVLTQNQTATGAEVGDKYTITITKEGSIVKKIETIENEVGEISEEVSAIANGDAEAITAFILDSYIVTNGNVGSTVDLNRVTEYTYASIIYECKEGDMFHLIGRGGKSPRLWAFIDKNNAILSNQSERYDVEEDVILIAPQGASKLICNVMYKKNYSLYIYQDVNMHALNERLEVVEKVVISKEIKNLSNAEGRSEYFNLTSQTWVTSDFLKTIVFDVKKGTRIKTNTEQAKNAAIGQCFFDKYGALVKAVSNTEIANYELTKEDIDMGVVSVGVVYRTTTQVAPFYLFVETYETISDKLDNLTTSSAKLMDGKTIILIGDSQLGMAQDVDIKLQELVGGKVYNWGFASTMMGYEQKPYVNNWDSFSGVNIAESLATRDFSKMDASAQNEVILSNNPYTPTTISEMKAFNFGTGKNVILTIALGGNDMNVNRAIGDKDSMDKYELNGAMNLIVKSLLSAYPELKIIFVGTPYRVYDSTSQTLNGITLDSDEKTNDIGLHRYDYNDAIGEQAKYLKIPFYDMYRLSGINKYNVWTLCFDGVHPRNPEGIDAKAEIYKRILMTL